MMSTRTTRRLVKTKLYTKKSACVLCVVHIDEMQLSIKTFVKRKREQCFNDCTLSTE